MLLSSGYSDERSRWTDITEKGFRFLQNPYSINALLQYVRQTLDGDPRKTPAPAHQPPAAASRRPPPRKKN